MKGDKKEPRNKKGFLKNILERFLGPVASLPSLKNLYPFFAGKDFFGFVFNVDSFFPPAASLSQFTGH